MQQPLRHAPLLPLLPSPQDWPPLSSQVLLSVSQIKSHPSRNRSVNSRFAGLKPKSVGSGAIRLELPLRFSAPPTSRSLSVAVSTEVLCSALRQDLPQGLGTGCSLGPGHLKPRHQPTRSLTCSKSCLNIILSISLTHFLRISPHGTYWLVTHYIIFLLSFRLLLDYMKGGIFVFFIRENIPNTHNRAWNITGIHLIYST